MSEAERARRIAAGRPHALRIDAGAVRIAYGDRLLGDTAAVVDDFVVRRADGVPAYQLAVVVDDAAQGVAQVVRAADLADSTARQILLARRLGLPVPEYAHVGLVLGPDGARLAKRHGAVTLGDRPLGGGSRSPRRSPGWPTRSDSRATARRWRARASCSTRSSSTRSPPGR